MTSYISRRQRAHGTAAATHGHLVASLTPTPATYGMRGSMPVRGSPRGNAPIRAGSGRGLAVFSGAGMPCQGVGRSGEVVTVRSSTFTWSTPVEREAADVARGSLGQDSEGVELKTSSLDSAWTAADGEGERQRQQQQQKLGGEEGSSEANSSPRSGHRRRVSWAETVETKEVSRRASCDVFSPDLHSLEIAKRLATLAGEPELQRAAEAVSYIRREAAKVVRTLSKREGWKGSVEGVEEACRLWSWREKAYLREMDEIVRCVVALGAKEGHHTSGPYSGADDCVWQLKATYRAARRRMEDAQSD